MDKMAIDGDVEPVFENKPFFQKESFTKETLYIIGIKVRWLLLGDILWFLGIQNSNKLKALQEFLKFSGMGYDVLSFRDPMPALGTILEGLKSLTLKERRNHAFDRGW
jgi:hypothetical protein